MSWISDKLLGLRQVFFGGTQLHERKAIEFTGDGVEVEDDAVNKRTVVTIAGGGGGGEGNYLPLIDTYPTEAGQFYVTGGELWGYATAQGLASPLMYELNNPVRWDDRLDAAATSMTERVLSDGTLVPAYTIFAQYTPEDDLAADNDDYAIIRIYSRPAIGGDRVLQLEAVTLPFPDGGPNSTGNWTAFRAVQLSDGNGGSRQVPAESMLTWEITPAGSGVSVPTGRLFVYALRTAAFPPGA